MNKFAIILVLIYNLFFNTAIASALSANNTDLSEEVLFIPNTSKPKIKYSKPVDKKSDTLTLKQNKEELLNLINIQKEQDLEDIEMLWDSTVSNNNVIKFAIQKLAMPDSQRRIHSSLMSKTLSALVTGASYLPSMLGANSLIQSTTFATGKIAQNLINKDVMPKTTPLSDTELIQLASVIEDLQNEIITSYYNYKTSLAKIKELREKLLLYNKNYSQALLNKDDLEITISSALYDDLLLEESKFIFDAKKYHMELQRLAGKKAMKNLKLTQWAFKSEIFNSSNL